MLIYERRLKKHLMVIENKPFYVNRCLTFQYKYNKWQRDKRYDRKTEKQINVLIILLPCLVIVDVVEILG